MAETALLDLPTSWKVAVTSGAQFYFTGRMCKRGHVAKRYASCGQCVECAESWWKRNTEAFRRHQKKSAAKRKGKIVAYRNSRKELNRKYQKSYRRENRKQINVNSNRWYHNNKSLVSERNKTVYRDNNAVFSRNRKARKKNAVGKHTAKDIKEIYRIQKGKCAYCRVDLGTKYHVDHIVALKNGGTNDRRNLQLLCRPCNLSKSARDPIEFMQERGMLL